MPFGDGTGPLWLRGQGSLGNRRFAGYGRGLGNSRGLRNGSGRYYESRFNAYDNKTYLEEEKRYLEGRIKDLDELLSSKENIAQK